MIGPELIVRTLSTPSRRDKLGRLWQYHSRSDHHSKVACWAVMFDLLRHCGTMRRHVESGRIAFGINHQMRDFRNNRKKDLDLVICTPISSQRGDRRTFSDLGGHYGISLDESESRHLADLPTLYEAPVGSVLVALEAKACMTAHQRALPRLYDELNSSHLTIHGATDEAIAACFVMVNAAVDFLSPDLNKYSSSAEAPEWSHHDQPKSARITVEKVLQIPRRSKTGEPGYDAMAIEVVDCRNDGSSIRRVTTSPAPIVGDIVHYDTMIDRLSHIYGSRFGHL